MYEELFAKAVMSVGGRPLSLVLYMDEVTPGDALAFRHDQQIRDIFVPFLQFGRELL